MTANLPATIKLPLQTAFPIGSLVWLKSGGPLMTIGGSRKDPDTGLIEYGAFWFDGFDKHCGAWFLFDMLEPEVALETLQ